MNSFGRRFRVSIFGESHGEQIGIIIDGAPAGIALSEADLQADLDRRRAGAKGTTPRKEADQPHIVSGVFNGHTTGAPLTVVFQNTDTRSGDYSNLVTQPRPGHADFVAREKWHGYSDYRGGGHFSGRITLGIVAAGAIAKKILGNGIKVESRILEIGGFTRQEEIDAAVQRAVDEQDSLGGIVECIATGVPVGWGEPFFDSVEAVLSHALFSIPAIKGVEFGAGFAAARMRGSEHNDEIIAADGTTRTNHAGGINGGISNGNPIVFRAVVKPTSSIARMQETYNFADGKVEPLVVRGRHDACIALRVPVVVEAMTAIVLCDFALVSADGRKSAPCTPEG
ncbi:chorismate synthase [uncultured Rikenella sp.]|uniref:chorismate synthase n=1 Tax=uncultured Rikenella sp. TaxID=368003 RepID=UPI002611FA70|nr:chorismate synthase [uncultured Rikenella sp.]